jgi:putative hemolysin
MATPCEAISFPQESQKRPALAVAVAGNEREIHECQRLRYQIFAEEMGAILDSQVPGIDRDIYDQYAKHLLVKDTRTGEIVGTTRLITDISPDYGETYYSQSEFALDNVLSQPGRFMEIGRTCIHSDYRTGSTIAVLWQGIARMMVMHDIDYLIGCASIGLEDGGANAAAIMERIRDKHLAPKHLTAFPKITLPMPVTTALGKPQIPSLLKAYLRLGALICGEAYWDEKFNVADVFVLMKREQIDRRYARHFVQSA